MPRRRRCLPLVLATAMLAATAAPASAEILVDGGLITEPGGIVRTPDGALWVTDGLSGICKVDAAGTGYVFDDYCADPAHLEVPEDPNAPEVPVVAPTAPTGAADMEFDALSSSFYVAEGTSKSSGIWRLHWNAATGAIDSAEKIHNSVGDNRVFALTLGRVPAPTVADPLATTLEVDFATKRSPIVRRITGAETGVDLDAPGIGAAIAEEPVAIARFGGDVFLAEATGVTRIDNPGGAGSTAEPFAPLNGVLPGALLADPTENRLYVGTDGGNGADEIFALNGLTGATESYAGGMSSITALALDSDGGILAGDDPATASGAVDAAGGGRIFKFAPAPLGLPRVELLTAPSPVTAVDPATGTLAAAFTFQATVGGATLECELDGSGTWTDCTDGAFAADVAPGTHELAIRAITGLGTGRAIRYVFVADDTVPEVSIDNPESDRVLTRRSLNLKFTASEGGATFTCAVDGAAPVPCSSPLALRNLSLGAHEVVVQATDMVGFVSAPVSWTFEVTDPPPPPANTGNSGSGSQSSGSSNSGSSNRPADTRRPVAFSADSRNDPCRPGVTTTLDMRRPPAVIRVRFATGQRPGYIRMVVTRKAKRAGRAPVKVLTMHRVVESSKPCTNVGWGLWRSEARKLRTGRYVLEVHAGPTRSTLKRTWRGGLNVVKRTR